MTSHFYPAAHKLIWFVGDEPVIVARAWGGTDPIPGVHYDVMAPQRMTPGRYVIDSYGPYVTRKWKHSNIRPENEAEVSRGLKVGLLPSHGCIHVDPIGRDRLHAAGAFDRGTDLLIHGYNEPLPERMR